MVDMKVCNKCLKEYCTESENGLCPVCNKKVLENTVAESETRELLLEG